jgi:hypothetical protein
MNTIQIVYMLLLVGVLACEKAPYQETVENSLPPRTMTGENTFGCYLDNFVFTAKDKGVVSGIDAPVYYPKEQRLILRTSNHRDFIDEYYFYFNLSPLIKGKGAYVFNDVAPAAKVVERLVIDEQDDLGSKTSFKYYLDTTRSNIIKFNRFDLDAEIVSGVFEFTAVNDSLQDTLRIIDGRFDLNGLLIVD